MGWRGQGARPTWLAQHSQVHRMSRREAHHSCYSIDALRSSAHPMGLGLEKVRDAHLTGLPGFARQPELSFGIQHIDNIDKKRLRTRADSL